MKLKNTLYISNKLKVKKVQYFSILNNYYLSMAFIKLNVIYNRYPYNSDLKQKNL